MNVNNVKVEAHALVLLVECVTVRYSVWNYIGVISSADH
jgi:hypothetical protein